MSLYKVGDKVRIRRDLGARYGYPMADGSCSNSVVPSMAERRGEEVEILSAWGHGYFISGDAYAWTWTDSMFEGAVGDESSDFGEFEIEEKDFDKLLGGLM